jgi:hypothetical protein
MSFKKVFILLSLAQIVFLGATTFADEYDKVKVLEDRQFNVDKKYSFHLGIEHLPMDAYYKPLVLDIGGSYRINDHFIWEVAHFGWSLSNLNTGLQKDIETQTNGYRYDPPPVMKKFRFDTGSKIYWDFLYGKSNFTNRKVIYHQWLLGGGFNYFYMTRKSQIAAEVSLKVNFFVSEHYSIFIRGAHNIGFLKGAPKNITVLGLGAGFSF